jgi:hypothetical protein
MVRSRIERSQFLPFSISQPFLGIVNKPPIYGTIQIAAAAEQGEIGIVPRKLPTAIRRLSNEISGYKGVGSTPYSVGTDEGEPMIQASNTSPSHPSTRDVWVVGLILAVVGALWAIAGDASNRGVAWSSLLAPPLFSAGVATFFVALSRRTAELVGILLRLVASVAVVGSGFLQWVGAGLTLGLSGPYNSWGEWVTPTDPQLRVYFASLQWSQVIGVLLAVAGVIWCLSTLRRFFLRIF